MYDTLVKAEGVNKSFGSKPVLKGVDFTLGPGDVYGLIGLNGTGKTTFLRTLLGILKPDTGEISALGYNPADAEPGFYKRCGVVLENSGFYGDLSFYQNLEFYALAKGIRGEGVKDYLKEYWKESDIVFRNKKTKFFSRGQKMIAALARAFVGSPELCILDEPAVALDMYGYEILKRIVKERAEKGGGIIVSSHQLDLIESLCTRIGVLEDGKIGEYSLGCKSWNLRTGAGFEFMKSLVSEISSVNEVRELDEGRFELEIKSSDSGETISKTIEGIVEGGYPVYEVYETGNNLKESLKYHYEKR